MQFELLICFARFCVLSSVVVLLFSVFQIGSLCLLLFACWECSCQTDATEVQRASQFKVPFCCIQRVESESVLG